MTLIDSGALGKKLGTNYSPQHIRRLVAAGILPPPVKMGQGKNAKNAWIEEEVDARIAARIRERNKGVPAERKRGSTARKAA